MQQGTYEATQRKCGCSMNEFNGSQLAKIKKKKKDSLRATAIKSIE